MTTLLELKEELRSFYGKYETYLLPVLKFLLAITVFWAISDRLGYMERLNRMSLLLILALACSVLPVNALLLIAGALIVLHCYALSLPVGITVLVLFLIMYLLYFRFVPQTAYNVFLAPVAFGLGVPYIMPVANGLLGSPVSVLSTICGTITYYFLKGVTENAASLSEIGEESTILDKFSEIINQFTGNKEMYLTILTFVVITFLVYLIRRLSVDYAWIIAIMSGILLEFLIFLIGYMEIGLWNRSLSLTIGCVVSGLIALVIEFFFFNLDYTRTERVQFEDDEYYYYVKAIPKRYVSTPEKRIKKISGNDEERQRALVTKEELMEDMDIHLKDDQR